MIVFDVDGTLIGGESVDFASFDAAFEEVAGFAMPHGFAHTLEEVTAQAIVHRALAARADEQWQQKEPGVRAAYLARLRRAHAGNPSAFPAAEGAIALLATLKAQGFPVAIATGDWHESISFKLGAAGIPIGGIHLVSSSDHYGRADIIAAAVRKTGRSLSETIYVGDGLWDMRACQKLGIPFIGVGKKIDRLIAAGAARTLRDLTPGPFLEMIRSINLTRTAAK